MTTINDYGFAIGRKINKVFIEGELYLDGKKNKDFFGEKPSVRRLDTPIFILLDNETLVRLYSYSLSIADDYAKEYVFSSNFVPNNEAQNEFERLCGLTITDVEEFYEFKYDSADNEGNIKSPDDNFNNLNRLTDLAILFDNGLRLVCYSFLDFFDIDIVEAR